MAKPSLGAPAPALPFFTPAPDQSTVSHLKVTVQSVTPKPDGSLHLDVTSGNVRFGVTIFNIPGRPDFKTGDKLVLEYFKGRNPLTDYTAIYHADQVPPPPQTKKDSMSTITTTTVQTMTSREIAELTGKQHKDVLYDIRKMLESLGLSTADFSAVYKAENGQSYEQFVLQKRETLILVSGYSVEMRAKIIDRWQELEQKEQAKVEAPKRKATSVVVNAALDKLRTANALKIATETAAALCARFPNLSANAQQTIYSKIINPIAGDEVLMLPRVDAPLMLAGKVGELFGVSGNKIGRLANQHNMKTDEYGEYRLDKSQHSIKQVDVFHYNAKAVDRFRELLAAEVPEKVVSITAEVANAD